MRAALLPLLLVCLSAPACALHAQDDGEDTPAPPAPEVVALPAPAPLPALARPAPALTLTLTGATAPARFTALVASLSVNAPLVPGVAAVAPAQRLAAVVNALSASGQLAATVRAAPVATLLDALTITAADAPETARLLLTSIRAGGRLAEVVLALQDRLPDPLRVDRVQSEDLDVLVAVAAFGAQDSRYPRISGYSAFGRRLADVRARITAEGMTPENKAALLATYRDAAEALRAFLAAEAAAAPPAR